MPASMTNQGGSRAAPAPGGRSDEQRRRDQRKNEQVTVAAFQPQPDRRRCKKPQSQQACPTGRNSHHGEDGSKEQDAGHHAQPRRILGASAEFAAQQPKARVIVTWGIPIQPQRIEARRRFVPTVRHDPQVGKDRPDRAGNHLLPDPMSLRAAGGPGDETGLGQ